MLSSLPAINPKQEGMKTACGITMIAKPQSQTCWKPMLAVRELRRKST